MTFLTIKGFERISEAVGSQTWAVDSANKGAWYNVGRVAEKAYSAEGFATLVFSQSVFSGVSSVLSGGKFGHGFATGFATKLSGAALGGVDTGLAIEGIDVVQVTAAAIVGGTVSKLSGGKFANGAVTAAFLNIFNQQDRGRIKEQNDLRRKTVLRRSTVPLKTTSVQTTTVSLTGDTTDVESTMIVGDVPDCCETTVSVDQKFSELQVDVENDPFTAIPGYKYTKGGFQFTKQETFNYSPMHSAGPQCFTCDAINIREASPVLIPGKTNFGSDFIDNWSDVYRK